MIDLHSLLHGIKDHGNVQYSGYCPVCEKDKLHGDPHLYFTNENGKWLINCKKGCDVQDICNALGVDMKDLFDSPSPVSSGKWEKLREHVYCSVDGLPVGKKIIFRLPEGSKTGIWYRWENGQYEKGLNKMKMPLYHLPQLVTSIGIIYIVEGEKDVETMERLGYTATTTPNGAGGQTKLSEDEKRLFAGRAVVVIGDNDDAGQKYAEIICNTLRKKAAKVINLNPMLLWEELPEKGDISDIAEHLGDDETKTRIQEAFHQASQDDLYNRPYIYKDDKKSGDFAVSAPLLADYIRKNMQYLFVKSDTKSSVQRYMYQDGCYRHISDAEFKGYIKDNLPLPMQSTRTVNEVFGLLDTDYDRFYTPEDLNADEHYINFTNGILNLDDMTMIEHSPDILSTIQIPCNYNPNAQPPESQNFDSFINHLCYGDKERIKLVLEFMGVSLSNIAGYRAKKALFMVGQGDTGKSQCKELISKLIGSDYVCSIDISELEKRFGTSNIYGKRLAGSSDMGYMTVDELKLFKQITGGDTIFAEHKGENGFHFRYKGVLWFCCNEMPKFGGDKGEHVYKRMMILECSNPVEKKDPELLEKMYFEREYIVYRCVQALRAFIKRGYQYTTPVCCVDAVKQYQTDNDSVLRFINECTTTRNGRDTYNTKKVYESYVGWCRANGEYTVKKSEFKRTLEKSGIGESYPVNGSYYYKSFQLNEDGKDYVF